MADPHKLKKLKAGSKPPVADAGTAAMIRVDQAGEYGATRIYAGQLAVMDGRHPDADLIRHMAAQEAEHLERFNSLLTERQVRPSLLQPVWHVAGFALGAATALMGPRAAMACTAAIETEIDHHYQEQLDQLGSSDPELTQTIAAFKAEELEHKASAIAHGAEETPGYPLLASAIRLGCRVAIRAARRF